MSRATSADHLDICALGLPQTVDRESQQTGSDEDHLDEDRANLHVPEHYLS